MTYTNWCTKATAAIFIKRAGRNGSVVGVPSCTFRASAPPSPPRHLDREIGPSEGLIAATAPRSTAAEPRTPWTSTSADAGLAGGSGRWVWDTAEGGRRLEALPPTAWLPPPQLAAAPGRPGGASGRKDRALPLAASIPWRGRLPVAYLATACPGEAGASGTRLVPLPVGHTMSVLRYRRCYPGGH